MARDYPKPAPGKNKNARRRAQWERDNGLVANRFGARPGLFWVGDRFRASAGGKVLASKEGFLCIAVVADNHPLTTNRASGVVGYRDGFEVGPLIVQRHE